ncbi:MAG TPA: NUDIX hydrolase [Actinomycetota bacterium]|nr:NUDIX hydrolase [Actinomycetota bacterium]
MKLRVRAAGGVVRRRQRGETEVALVHRPRYDDWTFPKGKALDGEPDEQTAEREVREETGLRCDLGPELERIRYRDHFGRPKVVRYWLMYPAGGSFVPNREVDDLRWVDVATARTMLTYERDRRVLADALAFDRPVHLVRHAKAADRASWTGDDLRRPLSPRGLTQADALVSLFRSMPVDRVVSSPATRCLQTMRPLAAQRSMRIWSHDELLEGASLGATFGLVRSLGGAVVACSHGDVIPPLVMHLAGRGVPMLDPPAWKKGSTWILERDGGLFTAMRYLAPPPA